MYSVGLCQYVYNYVCRRSILYHSIRMIPHSCMQYILHVMQYSVVSQYIVCPIKSL